LAATLVPVTPRLAFEARLKAQLAQAQQLAVDTPAPLTVTSKRKYIFLGAASILSSVLVLIASVRTIITFISSVGQWQLERKAASSSLNPA
jgi:hypothetical protein